MKRYDILSEIMNHLREWLEDEHNIRATAVIEVESLDIDVDDLDVHIHLRLCMPMRLIRRKDG